MITLSFMCERFTWSMTISERAIGLAVLGVVIVAVASVALLADWSSKERRE